MGLAFGKGRRTRAVTMGNLAVARKLYGGDVAALSTASGVRRPRR